MSFCCNPFFFQRSFGILLAHLLPLEVFFRVTKSFFNITCLFTRSSYLAILSFNYSYIPCIISSDYLLSLSGSFLALNLVLIQLSAHPFLSTIGSERPSFFLRSKVGTKTSAPNHIWWCLVQLKNQPLWTNRYTRLILSSPAYSECLQTA